MKIIKYFLIFFLLYLTSYIIPPALGEANAQDLSLSISPPIIEVMIMPGKKTQQTFSIINEGMDGYASVRIVPFTPQDEEGNVNVIDNPNFSDTAAYENWFTLLSPSAKFGDKFFLRQGEKKDIKLTISPPVEAKEKDYYFTLLYEMEPGDLAQLGGYSGNISKAKIGANLLISVSKDGKPYKKAQVVEFSAPKLIDSLSKLSYTLRIENTGQFFFKPTGKITVNPLFGKKEVLEIAPVNIVSSTVRNVPCILAEELIKCTYDKTVLAGFYKATASFTTDGEGKEYVAQTTTIALPFTIVFAITSVFLVFFLVRNITNKDKKRADY